MLLNYKVENFLSFREQLEFSMMAPKTKVKKRFPNNYVSTKKGCDILKTSVIVGENAGGKSNFVRSLEYLQSFFIENRRVKTNKRAVNSSNVNECPRKSNSCIKFEIEALVEQNIYYLYNLEVDFWGIKKETLFFKEDEKQIYKLLLSAEREECFIDCDGDTSECEVNECEISGTLQYDLTFPSFNSEMEDALNNTIKNSELIGLFVTKLAILGDNKAIQFTEWLKDNLCPETYALNYDIYKSVTNAEEDLKILRDTRYLDIFKMIDYSIVGIEIDEEKPFIDTIVVREKKNGEIYKRTLKEDSSGVREFFAWAVQIFRVVYENRVVVADEMDRVLNPVLSDRVISFINGKKHCGQFVFTTHNVLHLDLRNYMKEQIYFITKDAETLESEIYSLADFPEIRYDTAKIYEFYMKGILGGTAIE